MRLSNPLSSLFSRLFRFRRGMTGREKFVSVISKLFVVGVVCAVVGGFVLTIALAWISRDLPDPNTLMHRDIELTTQIYDRTGTHLLYELHGDKNRTLIALSDLPSYVPHATVAIEDKGFYTHGGIYWKGLVRAVLLGVLNGGHVRGTSTLTQQFVKNAILNDEHSLTRKLKEGLLALQIERVFSKDQILQLYLNEIPYGSTVYGIESAARNYFGKSAKDLTLDEAVVLAALPQAPSYYSPYGTGPQGDHRDILIGRAHYILDQMVEQGYITKDEAEAAKQVDTLKKIVPKKVGSITAPHFVDYIQGQLEEKYGGADVRRKGLKVTTTLDWDTQNIAQEEVTRGVDERGKKYEFTNGALVALNPKNGQILAMVGSKDFFDDKNDGQVNVALSPRQPGSSFKPIVYAAALIKGYTPETTLWDVNTVFKTDVKNYEPKNYDLKEHGPVSMRVALQGSLNIPAVETLYLVGVSRVLDFAERLGYTTFADRSRFGLALVLGGGEVRLLDHVHAYATFANQGVSQPVVSILKVEDAQGQTLEEWTESEGAAVMDRDVANRLSDILSDNASRAYVFGLKNFLTLPDRPVAAKTGTTNDFHDAWTLGYTPSLAAGVWVGNNNNVAMKRGADGSQIAAPIWQAFMKRALQKTPAESFPKPPPTQTTKPVLLGQAFETKIKIDKVTGKRANAFTPPELIEERMFHEAHSILWYVDKDDPQGPPPSDPTQDPQFTNWESAVQDWVARTGWNTTSTAPTEEDDVHTAANAPIVTIYNPQPNTTWTERVGNIQFGVSAPRRITHVDATSEGVVIGSSYASLSDVSIRFPNVFERGYHDVVITAYDDVGNHGSATVTINLNAEESPVSLHIQKIEPAAPITAASFPLTVTIEAADAVGAKKIDLYIQRDNNSTELIGSDISPQQTSPAIQWTTAPPPGLYTLVPILTDANDITHLGDPMMVSILP